LADWSNAAECEVFLWFMKTRNQCGCLVRCCAAEHRDDQPHNNTIEIDIEVAADNDRHDSQMITQDISDDDNDDANADDDDDDEDDEDDDRNHGECF